MAGLFRGLRTLALASESQRAFKAAADRKELVKTAGEQRKVNRGLATEQSARLRLAEAAQRAYTHNRETGPGSAGVERMAALLQAIDRNRAAGKPLSEIFRKRRN